MSSAQVRALRALIEPIAVDLDCDLERVTIQPAGSRRVVRVVVDHDAGLSLDLVADISRRISRALDENEVLGESAYVLEVTSPGVDRPLSSAKHWARAHGRMVAVSTRDKQRVEGRVSHSDDSSATLDVEGQLRRIEFTEVARAVVQVELRRMDEVELEESEDSPELPESLGPDDPGAGPQAGPSRGPDQGQEPDRLAQHGAAQHGAAQHGAAGEAG